MRLDRRTSTLRTALPAATCGTVLACEKAFLAGLNTAATNSGSVNHIGLVVFGAEAVPADMTPAAGDVALGAPAGGNTVVNSISLINANFNYQIGHTRRKRAMPTGPTMPRRCSSR